MSAEDELTLQNTTSVPRPSRLPRILSHPASVTNANDMADLDPQQKIALIRENLQEVLRLDIIEDVIIEENRPLTIYWGSICPQLLVVDHAC